MSQLKGLSKAKVIMRHALPNAWAPIATVIAFNLAYLVVGVVVVEVVFVYPWYRPIDGGRSYNS
jgi:peptide/nickel transport system permease protein